MVPRWLLPPSPRVHITAVGFDSSVSALTISLVLVRKSACCPLCGTRARHIHSRYHRSLSDLPWADVTVRLELQVRKFFCRRPTCQRRIFTERIPELARPWARQTVRRELRCRALGQALGGRAGARLGHALSLPVSRHTLVRQIRRTPTICSATPAKLGVDDWAIRKGRRYGTILVDLAQHTVIDLLTDDSAASFAAWLKAHPGVELISRDRGGAYADGAQAGAPQAVQVADRWHLIKNVGDVLARVLDRHREVLKQLTPGPAVLVDPPPTPVVPPALSRRDQDQQRRRKRREARFIEIQTCYQRGMSLHAIARELHLDRRTVRKYCRAPACPEPQTRARRRSVLDPYKAHLLTQWNAGCHVGTTLLAVIRAQGYCGGRSIVMDFVARLRREQRGAVEVPLSGPVRSTRDPMARPPTPRSVVWVVLQRPDKLTDTDRAQIIRVRAADPELNDAVLLAQAFTRMVREQRADELAGWLEWAREQRIAGFPGFVLGIERDYAAVYAALSRPESNGVTEGHVNRLKYLKRQMYGRAKFDLLRARVLYRS